MDVPKYVENFLFKRKLEFFGLLFVVFVLAKKVVRPFLNSNIFFRDMLGHFFASWYQKNYIFPEIFGWNPYFFGGYMQNRFYPPLFSYLSAFFGNFIGLETAFKFLIVFSVLLIPFSAYFLCRKIGFDIKESLISVFLIVSTLFMFSRLDMGGTFHGAFETGLVTSLFALPFLLFYFSILFSGEERPILLTLLFSTVLLSHPYMAIVAAIGWLSVVFCRYFEDQRTVFLVKHIILSALLTAFWTVPFLLNIEGFSIGGFGTDFAGFYLLDKLPLIIWTGLFGFLGYNYFSKKKVFSYLSTFLAFLTFFMFLGSRYASLRVYRFGLFFYMFLPLLFLSFFKLTNFSKNIFLVLTGLALIFSPSIAFNQRGNIGFEIDDVGEGRILVAASSNSQPTSLFYHHAVPMVSGNPGVKGLFVESSPNAPYFQALEGFVEPDTFLWANRPSRRSSRSPENLSDYLNFFGVNYVFHDSEDFLEDLNKFEEIDIQYYDGEFSLYSVGNTSYVEVFEGEMSSVESELWADEVDNWFYEGDFSKLLVEENFKGDSENFVGGDVNVLEVSDSQDFWRVETEFEEDKPILFKVSYDSGWKAYSEEGSLDVYRASPNFVLVKGSGEIILEHFRNFSDYLGIFISVLGFLIMLLFFFRN